MSYTDTRTAQYEAHEERIQTLRNEAVDCTTLARAYESYAEQIEHLPSMGAVADLAAKELSAYSRGRASYARSIGEAKKANADRLEHEGLR